MTKLTFFGDTDSTSDADAVLAATVKENADAYIFVGDGPYATSGTKWVTLMKKYFDDKKDKLIFSRGNHDEDESESKQTQKDIEAWFPECKSLGISDTWLISKQVGNVYVISMDTQDLDVEFKRDQFNWVQTELAKAKQLRAAGTIDWIVVLAHKPFFTLKSSHSPYTAVRFLYKELFADAQVDFIIHGHNHNTQTWKPMVPNASQANGEGEQLFTLAADGKTYDFTKLHGWLGIVWGASGHEHNAINDSGAGVQNVQYFNDDTFCYGVIETDANKKAKAITRDVDAKVMFETNVTREGGVVEPPECSDPAKCIDPVTKECRQIGINEHKSPTDGSCQPNTIPTEPQPICPPGYTFNTSICMCVKNPDPGCPPGQHKDPVTGLCVDDVPGTTICPRDYHFDISLQRCIPDLEPQLNPICPAGTTWNGKVCVGSGPPPPPGCPDGQCKDATTGQCRPIGANEIKDAFGMCAPKPVLICPDGQCKDPTTGLCRNTGVNEQKNPTTGMCEPKPTIICPDGQCKDTTTGLCRPIGANEEKDVNGFCKVKQPPEPGGDIDEFGMKLLHKTTGNKVAMEKGSDHRNGQRYNVNHKFLNYMVQGYFKLGKGQAKIEHKTDGPNHGGCTKLPICMWYEMGYEIATGRNELQYEAPHPDNHDIPDTALDFQAEVKCQPESWIGYEIAIWDSAEGRRMEQYIDPDPFDASGKPKNTGWTKGLGATEKGQLFPKEFFPRNLKELIPQFENGFESEIRMHQGTNHDTDMKNVWVFEIEPPN